MESSVRARSSAVGTGCRDIVDSPRCLFVCANGSWLPELRAAPPLLLTGKRYRALGCRGSRGLGQTPGAAGRSEDDPGDGDRGSRRTEITPSGAFTDSKGGLHETSRVARLTWKRRLLHDLGHAR